MYRRYGKKVFVSFFAVMTLFIFVSTVLAVTSTTYTFKGDGAVISVESNDKISGSIYLRASRSSATMNYDGTLRFVLYKKNIFGTYKEYSRSMRDTYKDINIVVSYGSMANAYYKGTLQLYSPDTSGQYSGLTTTFSIGTNS